MKSYIIIMSIAIAAAWITGCSHSQVQKQDTNEKQSVDENTKGAIPDAADAENAGNAQINDTAPKPCGPTTLNAADAEKWDCVPDIGYWCTDPAGCPVNGQIAKAGTRLGLVRPLPQGTQYEYVPGNETDLKIDLHKESHILHSNSTTQGVWKCTSNTGCMCGTGKIQADSICYGDTYTSESALENSPCSEQNCHAYCRDNQCVCGDIILVDVKHEGLQCKRDHQICTNKNGCEYQGKNYSQYESWTEYTLICDDIKGCSCGNASCKLYDTCLLPEGKCITPDEFWCNKSEGCPCGTMTCNESEKCITAESKCIDRRGERTPDNPVEKRSGNNIPECDAEEGCKCGSQICPQYYKCMNDLCVYVSGAGDGSDGHFAFYCDKPEGCSCGSPATICPMGAVCDQWDGDHGWTDAFGYRCAKVDQEKVKDEKSLFEFLKDEFSRDIIYDVINSDTNNIIFDEQYFGSYTDVALHQNYVLNKKDGKEVGMYVVCSQPGCDCSGVPLAENYLCVEQHVVFATESSDDFGICPWPYYGFTHDAPSTGGSCDIADNINEQICFNPKGCSCGTETIPMGDVCIDDHAQCSTLQPRAGCTCGNEKPGKGYGCYHEQLICQTNDCQCHGKTIHLGDICTKEGVICGANSHTVGCLCDETPLKDGYRCFQKEQICACHTDTKDCNDEECDNTDVDRKPCTCKCGEQTIKTDAACKNDKPAQLHNKGDLNKHAKFNKIQCGNRGEMYSEENLHAYVMYKSRKYRVDNRIPELARLACTCGTGVEAPGEGYACAIKEDTKGNGSEWMSIALYAGWQCNKYEGCICGNKTCRPGDLCTTDEKGNQSCEAFNTIDGNCGGHKLPPHFVYENGYECYDLWEATNAKGWYCGNIDGCSCGDVTCEQYQMCLSHGYCSKHKLTSESELEELKRPIIDRCKELPTDLDCKYDGTDSMPLTSSIPDSPPPIQP